jgi:hypothetical protein
MTAFRFALLSVPLAVACESPSGPAAVQIETRSPTYQLGTAVTFTVVNTGSSEVFLSYCCNVGVALDRWQNSRWLSGSAGGCVAICSMVPISLLAHGSHVDSTAVADTGRYRLHVGVASSRTAQPDWSPTSNAFEVK